MSGCRDRLFICLGITSCTMLTLHTCFCTGSRLVYCEFRFIVMSECRDYVFIVFIRILLSTYFTCANFFISILSTGSIFCLYCLPFTMNCYIIRKSRHSKLCVSYKCSPFFSCAIITSILYILSK